ncbi:hypothetical protein FRC06_010290 [Ceratobasidium sp. 370]|nr:hypothetical protein FRC06_010290 [Ceratobasidium sp. 370]
MLATQGRRTVHWWGQRGKAEGGGQGKDSGQANDDEGQSECENEDEGGGKDDKDDDDNDEDEHKDEDVCDDEREQHQGKDYDDGDSDGDGRDQSERGRNVHMGPAARASEGKWTGMENTAGRGAEDIDPELHTKMKALNACDPTIQPPRLSLVRSRGKEEDALELLVWTHWDKDGSMWKDEAVLDAKAKLKELRSAHCRVSLLNGNSHLHIMHQEGGTNLGSRAHPLHDCCQVSLQDREFVILNLLRSLLGAFKLNVTSYTMRCDERMADQDVELLEE